MQMWLWRVPEKPQVKNGAQRRMTLASRRSRELPLQTPSSIDLFISPSNDSFLSSSIELFICSFVHQNSAKTKLSEKDSLRPRLPTDDEQPPLSAQPKTNAIERRGGNADEEK